MPVRPVPSRHWRSYGGAPLPTGKEALDEPFRAFPSWFLRIACERCGKERMISETHMPQGDLPNLSTSSNVAQPTQGATVVRRHPDTGGPTYTPAQ